MVSTDAFSLWLVSFWETHYPSSSHMFICGRRSSFILMWWCWLHSPVLMLHGKVTTPEIIILSFLFPVLYVVLHPLTRLHWSSLRLLDSVIRKTYFEVLNKWCSSTVPSYAETELSPDSFALFHCIREGGSP